MAREEEPHLPDWADLRWQNCSFKKINKKRETTKCCEGCCYSYTFDVSHEKRLGCRPPALGNRSFFTQPWLCGGIPPGLVLGHLPEGGQPQWGCAAWCQALCSSSMKPQGRPARNRWPGSQQSVHRLAHTPSTSILMIPLTHQHYISDFNLMLTWTLNPNPDHRLKQNKPLRCLSGFYVPNILPPNVC